MIIIGYYGIGKTTLAQRNQRYIDLEDRDFLINNFRPIDWEKIYCRIAERLSAQGYIVLVSPFKTIRDILSDSQQYIATCVPNLELKDEWIEKLRKIWENGEYYYKEFREYKSAFTGYEKNIKDIMSNENFHNIILNSMDYDLQSEIERNVEI